MATLLATNWWVLALRGLAAIAFGVLTLLVPGVSLAALVFVFASYALVDGVLTVIAAFRGQPNDRPWWSLALEGLVSIGAGAAAFLMPGVTTVMLVYVVAGWALITGALEIATAVRLRRHISGEWRMILAGVASLAFGTLLMLAPAMGAVAMVMWIGAYALVFGAALLALALRVRSATPQPPVRRLRRVA